MTRHYIEKQTFAVLLVAEIADEKVQHIYPNAQPFKCKNSKNHSRTGPILLEALQYQNRVTAT